MDEFSLLLLEKDLYHDVQVSWIYPEVSTEDQERLIKASASRETLIGSIHEFYVIKHDDIIYSCYRLPVDQIKHELAVQEATLVCISSKSHPKRDESILKELLQSYLSSKGNATAMLQLTLKMIATGKCGDVDLKSIVE